MHHPTKERAIIVHVVPHEISRNEAERDLEELVRLVETYGGVVILEIIQKRGRPSAKTYVGPGKLIEVRDAATKMKAKIVIVNQILKPTQILSLKETLPKDIKVWDRVDIILNIFDKHARSEEAKLQIQVARLRHDIPKIYARHATTLFERERGGISATRGAGERGIEQEKRHIRSLIKSVEEKIAHTQNIRATQRKQRKRAGLKTFALVGYTNSGKSTLLKSLTKKKNVYIADELFATLDTKIGNLWLEELNKSALIADTIGFIQNLPPFLIASFKATLGEIIEADVLLHVIDASDEKMYEKIEVVQNILDEIECTAKPMIYVFNKVDVNKKIIHELEGSSLYSPYCIVSALEHLGLEQLKKHIQHHVSRERYATRVR